VRWPMAISGYHYPSRPTQEGDFAQSPPPGPPGKISVSSWLVAISHQLS
jgi:hypothetical protein